MPVPKCVTLSSTAPADSVCSASAVAAAMAIRMVPSVLTALFGFAPMLVERDGRRQRAGRPALASPRPGASAGTSAAATGHRLLGVSAHIAGYSGRIGTLRFRHACHGRSMQNAADAHLSVH